MTRTSIYNINDVSTVGNKMTMMFTLTAVQYNITESKVRICAAVNNNNNNNIVFFPKQVGVG